MMQFLTSCSELAIDSIAVGLSRSLSTTTSAEVNIAQDCTLASSIGCPASTILKLTGDIGQGRRDIRTLCSCR